MWQNENLIKLYFERIRRACIGIYTYIHVIEQNISAFHMCGGAAHQMQHFPIHMQFDLNILL